NHHHQRRLTPQQQQQQPPPLDRPSEALCRAALECLAHYFTWVPLSATITPTLLSTIFHYAAFGCEGAGGGGSTYAQRGGGGGVAPSPSTSNFATATLSSSSTVVPASNNNNNNNTASACGALPGGGGGGGGAMSAAAAAGGGGAGLGSAQLSASASSSSSSSTSTSAPGVAGGGVGADTHQLGVLAMNCINELLSKNCVPQEFEEFLLQMFQRSFLLLQRLTRDSATSTNGNRLADLDESYVEKFTDFLQLFVSIHLRRFESNAKFPVLDFLALLFKYTFRQPTTEGFYSCLDIWSVFLDYLLTRTELRAADQEEVRNRYRPALQSLVTHILQKLQFRYNQSQLEQLDDETLDDDCQTEWQQYLRQCLEVVAKVGEILSRDTFKLLNDLFQEYTEVYLGLEQYVVPNSGGGAGGTTGAVAPPGGRKLTITAENECRRLHCILRDLSSLEQALGRLAEHFIGDTFMENFNDADVLVQRLVHCVAYSGSAKLYEVSSIAQTVLQPDFIEVHAQALATLKAFSHWLSQYHCESQKVNQPQQFTILFSTLVDATLPLFQTQIPEKIVQSAAHLLLSLMVTVRPSYLLQMASVQELYTHIGQGHCKDMPQEVQLLLYRALSHYLLLPWPHLSDSEQDWEKRAGYHRDFTRQLTLNYCQLRDTQVLLENKALQESAKVLIEKTLKMCRDWVENIASESNKSKHICYQSLQEIVQVTLAILPVYIHQPDTADHILSFFLAVFQGLRVQMGVSFTEGIIQTFMGLFTREQLAENILHDNSAGCRVVERFLCILELIVQEPGSAFKAFLPSIISVCMDQVYPIVAQRSSPDIKCKLYKLLFELLVNNWRYFFNTSLASTITALHNSSSNTNSSNNGSNNSNSSSDLVQNGEQFVAIMQAFGQSFLQLDIALFRQNLEALEALNTKWKLYHKKVFRDSLLCEFLTVLLQVLLQKSHDLLQEEIAISVYNMASVDFDVFYSHFLPNFLTSCDGLVADQRSVLGHNFKMDKDMPSFTQSVNRFINDLRYYRLINTSLPPGSFKF
ncbi:exportin-6-like isoform X1, partial [Argonauta hians]